MNLPYHVRCHSTAFTENTDSTNVIVKYSSRSEHSKTHQSPLLIYFYEKYKYGIDLVNSDINSAKILINSSVNSEIC